MKYNKVEAINALFSFKLRDSDLVFLFLGYSGILLRSKDVTILIDPGKGLTHTEVSAIKHLDLLLFTHNHWDHFKKDHALEIFKQTRPQIVADVVSSEELKAYIPPRNANKSRPCLKVCNTPNR